MVRQKGTRKRKRLTEEQVQEMLRMQRQGQSVKAIAEAIGCHRQTVRLHLQEKRGDILATEVRRQVLTDVLEKHLNDVIEFAVSFRSHVTRPSSLTEDRDADTLFKPLLGKELPQGLDSDSQKTRREQRQIERRNRMLLMSLREHTRGQGWWTAYEEWREAWNTCVSVLQELRGEADEVVENRINETPSLKEEAERRIRKGKDTIEAIINDVLWVVWWASTGDKPVEEYKFQVEGDQVVAVLGDGSYYSIGHRLSEASLGPDMGAVCELAFKTLCQSFSDKSIAEMLQRMDEKIEVIDDALDPFILRPLLVRTRCELCPV